VSAPARQILPRVQHTTRPLITGWNRVGEIVQFFVTTLLGTKDVWLYYRVEMLRQIAQMSLGVGAMALIGGTIVVVAFLSSQVGSLVAIQVYGSLANVGIEALTGFASAYVNTRLVRSIPYLCSTRLVAGVVLSIPLYCLGMLAAWSATKLGTILSYGQSTGVYDHYFNTFLSPTDVMLSFLQAVAMATMVMLIHTYYGYNAAGGPAGVGAAVGRAVRASLVAVIFVLLFVAMGIYGQAGGLNISG
jgi:phospholipid/cholesterol/gamma-HCH transport system permease protein